MYEDLVEFAALPDVGDPDFFITGVHDVPRLVLEELRGGRSAERCPQEAERSFELCYEAFCTLLEWRWPVRRIAMVRELQGRDNFHFHLLLWLYPSADIEAMTEEMCVACYGDADKYFRGDAYGRMCFERSTKIRHGNDYVSRTP